MAKLDTLPGQSKGYRVISPIKTSGRTTTHEGGAAYKRTNKSELFMLAINFFFGEPTFYESADERVNRFRDLVHKVTVEDPEWMQRFIPWLRHTANIRTASIVAAVEYRAAGGPNPRAVIASTLARADEPAEAIAYAKSRGIAISGGLQRGIADASSRLFNEYTAMKYDGGTRNYRMGDVLNLVHPKPNGQWQDELFKFLLDKRHHQDAVPTDSLTKLKLRAELDEVPVKDRAKLLRTETGRQKIANSGITWESLSGWLQGPMDAAAWEAVIPTMGYMALLRNLRNFDQAGISTTTKKFVVSKLTDPEAVAKSKQFPYRFYSAYNEVRDNLTWASALETALDLSTQNIPVLEGRTEILVDTSASMHSLGFSRNSKMTPATTAALFGAALAIKGNEVNLYGFADGVFYHPIRKGASVLPTVESFTDRIGEVGHGTNIAEAVRRVYAPGQTKRIVIVSDMQTFGDTSFGYSNYAARLYGTSSKTVSQLVPDSIPMYGFNLAGYAPTVIESGSSNRHEFGGMSDATFKMLSLIEKAKSADWPF